MSSNKIRYRSIHELKDPSLSERLSHKEFSEEIPVDEFIGNEENMNESSTSRRDFLKFLGFSTAAVTLAACEAPVVKTIPYVVKPHDIIPGVPNYYATSCFDGFDFASVLVKTREGRPIKIEPNPSSKSLGVTNARVQASVLSLYDNDRIKQPKLNGKNATFSEVDDLILQSLRNAEISGKKIVLLSHSFPSPTFKKLFRDFKKKYSTAELVIYDAYPYTSALDAAEEVFGKRYLPVYDLKNTELVVSFAADFLSDYNANNLEKSYAEARIPGKNMLRHIQVESNMSLTGANADTRIKQKPSGVYKTLVEVYNGLNGGTSDKIANSIIEELKAKGSKAVVFAEGSKSAYVLSHLINKKLASNAFTGKPLFFKEFDAKKYENFLTQLNSEQVEVLITNNINPIYSSNKSDKFSKGLSKVGLIVSTSYKTDEMAKSAKVVIPTAHWLESWGDIMPETGIYSLMQPTIQKVYKSRQIEESLLVWINGKNSIKNNYYDYLRDNSSSLLGNIPFNKALYDGYNKVFTNSDEKLSYLGGNDTKAKQELRSYSSGGLELVLNLKTAIGDGTQANNPWLQELPDPISRMTWDNYLTISPADAEKFGLKNDLNARMQLDSSVVNVSANGITIKDVPVFIQPGQAEGSVGLALGYGKKESGKVAETGVNAYPLFDASEPVVLNVAIERTEKIHKFAGMQLQNTLMGRYEIAKEVTLDTFLNKHVNEWNKPLEMHTYGGTRPMGKVDLWDNLDDTDGPHFNLSVDLNACTGCGACVIACQAENNIPVVGKEEVRMSRDMFWLRIDRYYSSKEKIETKESLDRNLDVPDLYKILIEPSESPDVIFQPVMCQHCNHAPCETVCPVAATSHGKQGQNQMAYNRCVGTRYCANNCPYKVRRFNWFNYALNDKFDFNMNNDLGRMVLNPDVVVRTRGVMEKCSMCIQMTQLAILEAKKEGRKVRDGEFATACTNACSSGAMQFGDMNDKNSHVRKLFKSKRRYHLLEEVGTKPNVFYHTKIRNREEESEA